MWGLMDRLIEDQEWASGMGGPLPPAAAPAAGLPAEVRQKRTLYLYLYTLPIYTTLSTTSLSKP